MTIRAHATTFDCADAVTLATFWSEALGQPLDPDASEEFASIGMRDPSPTPPAGRWMFIKVPEPKSAKNRVHVDFVAADRAAEVERLVALGATKGGDFDEWEAKWTTLTDPEGNEFDVASAP